MDVCSYKVLLLSAIARVCLHCFSFGLTVAALVQLGRHNLTFINGILGEVLLS
jgi:hypothetical protein